MGTARYDGRPLVWMTWETKSPRCCPWWTATCTGVPCGSRMTALNSLRASTGCIGEKKEPCWLAGPGKLFLAGTGSFILFQECLKLAKPFLKILPVFFLKGENFKGKVRRVQEAFLCVSLRKLEVAQCIGGWSPEFKHHKGAYVMGECTSSHVRTSNICTPRVLHSEWKSSTGDYRAQRRGKDAPLSWSNNDDYISKENVTWKGPGDESKPFMCLDNA